MNNTTICNHHPFMMKKNQADTIVVGFIGARLIGRGIAMVLLQAGYTVGLVDINEKALQKDVVFLKRLWKEWLFRT